jgi:hypothetical protein
MIYDALIAAAAIDSFLLGNRSVVAISIRTFLGSIADYFQGKPTTI